MATDVPAGFSRLTIKIIKELSVKPRLDDSFINLSERIADIFYDSHGGSGP